MYFVFRYGFQFALVIYTAKSNHATRALPEITSSPEVRQIFKIQTVRKPDIFLPRCQTFNTFKNRKKIQKIKLKIFSIKCTNRYVVLFALTYHNPTDNCKDWRPPSLYTVNQIIHLTFKEHIKILWPGNATYEVIILRIYRPTFQTNTSSLRPYSFTTR